MYRETTSRKPDKTLESNAIRAQKLKDTNQGTWTEKKPGKKM